MSKLFDLLARGGVQCTTLEDGIEYLLSRVAGLVDQILLQQDRVKRLEAAGAELYSLLAQTEGEHATWFEKDKAKALAAWEAAKK